MRKYFILSLLLVVAVGLAAPLAFAQTTGTVKGICKDFEGKPIAQAEVLRPAQNPRPARRPRRRQLRRRIRRRAARRREIARQGARLQLPRRLRTVGPQEPAPRIVEPL